MLMRSVGAVAPFPCSCLAPPSLAQRMLPSAQSKGSASWGLAATSPRFNNQSSTSAGSSTEENKMPTPRSSHQEQDLALLRSMVSSQFQYSSRRPRTKPPPASKVTDLITKIQLAWKIFFPDPPMVVTPKDEVMRRLRMVLVADRCGMSPASLSEMKKTIVKALSDYVDIEGEDGIEVTISQEEGLGTVYSVNIPVRRIKAESRFGMEGELSPADLPDGVSMEWDPAGYDVDPSNRFPQGT
eukprot:CAMPEP_0119101730 /NCGR_PEP_ID=MMETSP1180-20130426/703_1 /TAXON_ID=3052 ORGANISM="Chlamydomonas cf sp, Strain CCMP681" /NCGR_SAMPLE_ID=MMETSP1180 /ASSEMBLY_ACC=CAM_ASM_000741 /LENGTH=240 /DNA_ID=CAMNT_0007085897 /DNA_START=37 /DNA_END=759 /DNA_ORIENTATION=-